MPTMRLKKFPAPFTFPAKTELEFTTFLEWVMGKEGKLFQFKLSDKN